MKDKDILKKIKEKASQKFQRCEKCSRKGFSIYHEPGKHLEEKHISNWEDPIELNKK